MQYINPYNVPVWLSDVAIQLLILSTASLISSKLTLARWEVMCLQEQCQALKKVDVMPSLNTEREVPCRIV